MRRCVTNGLEKETIVNLQWVLNLVEMFLRTDEYMRIKTFSAFEWQAPKVDCRCVTLWLPFYLGDNMGAEWDVILHQQVGEIEQITDVPLTSLHFPLLLPYGELGWPLAVRNQGVAIIHKNNRFSRHNYAAYRLWIKSIGYSFLHRVEGLFLCAVFTLITEMRVPRFSVSPGASKLILLLLSVFGPINIAVINHKWKCF